MVNSKIFSKFNACQHRDECKTNHITIQDLEQRVRDMEGCIERREQMLAEANSEKDSANDEAVVAWAEVDRLEGQLEHEQRYREKMEGRVKELEKAAESEISSFMAVAIALCENEAAEWDSDRLQTCKNYAQECANLISKITQFTAKDYIAKKQSDAIIGASNSLSESFPVEAVNFEQERAVVNCQKELVRLADEKRNEASKELLDHGDSGAGESIKPDRSVFESCAQIIEHEAHKVARVNGLGRKMAKIRLLCIAERLRGGGDDS